MFIKSISSILVTGGTGSFGKAFIKKLINDFPNLKRIVVYSRDELKQWQMQQEFDPRKYNQLRYFLGDIRDKERLIMAMDNIDCVVHAAALKQVPAAEYNPMEFIKTNVYGSENLVNACFKSNIKKLIALSTDKASAPINLYGATKLCSDKLFIAANNLIGSRDLSFSIVRYGNVMGSRGSVIPFFLKEAKKGTLPITVPEMTRFNISLEEGVNMVIWAINNSHGGEIFVPKIPSYRIDDVAEAIGPSCEKKIIGIRPGEKLHEQLISSADSYSTIDLGNYYAILPGDEVLLEKYRKLKIIKKQVEKGFIYDSGQNSLFLSVKQIRELIKLNINEEFVPI
tara:strand:+ start:71195 stop:72214 length:1020 start_codon:yes stop_codon:yes gene_type:complete